MTDEPQQPEKKIRVAIIFGGRSAEHEVSLESARNVMAALDPDRYEALPIGISKEGRWLIGADAMRQLQAAADATGGKAYVAPSADDLAKAYADIRSNLQESTGEAVTLIHELTWRYALAAVILLMIAWALGLWWLRGPL